MPISIGKISEYVLPANWVGAFINDDWTEYEDDEEQEIKQWLVDNDPGPCVGCTDDPEFTIDHDGGPFAADCLTFTFIKYKE